MNTVDMIKHAGYYAGWHNLEKTFIYAIASYPEGITIFNNNYRRGQEDAVKAHATNPKLTLSHVNPFAADTGRYSLDMLLSLPEPA